MSKPTGAAVAARAAAALPEGIAYARMDCKEFIEYCVRQCGGALDTLGTNDMARNHCAWLGTLGNAQAEGKLVKGALLLIHEETEADLPARYRGDGLGDFSHVGVYVGENALEDVDKQGKRRQCDVMHSSASMGRVAGSTVKNGWTHVMLLNEMDYGMETGGLSLGSAAAGNGDGASVFADAPVALPDVSGFYTVKRGCRGGAVRRLQGWLHELGYNVGGTGADGDFGAMTDAAVKTFQAGRGLQPDGIVGQRTWSELAKVWTDAANASDTAVENAGRG